MTLSPQPLAQLAIQFPSDWMHETYSGWPLVRVVNAPNVGALTIDYRQRMFRAGHSLQGAAGWEAALQRQGLAKPYGGARWKARLELAAVQWLRQQADLSGIPLVASDDGPGLQRAD